jgi:endonuclease/exonuclease/phosphatase family metal-dependent hydrolase
MTATPEEVLKELTALRGALKAIPKKTVSNLLIATWNLRAFGDLTEKWDAGPKDSPKRDWRAVVLIAEIVSRFDVVAVQEVRRETTALRRLLEELGDNWHFITSDVTEGDQGNDERLTFIYDADRVQPSGLIGEIVLPSGVDPSGKQFARSPYAASFRRGDVEFILTTLHVLWGSRTADRLPEITAMANWMRTWADRPNDWNENLLVLGDFNLDRLGNPLHQAFVSTGLWSPSELDKTPRTVFDNDRTRHFYDQIAWFSDVDDKGSLTDLLRGLTYNHSADYFDFIPHVFAGLTKEAISWRISDHYPLWVEFNIATGQR